MAVSLCAVWHVVCSGCMVRSRRPSSSADPTAACPHRCGTHSHTCHSLRASRPVPRQVMCQNTLTRLLSSSPPSVSAGVCVLRGAVCECAEPPARALPRHLPRPQAREPLHGHTRVPQGEPTKTAVKCWCGSGKAGWTNVPLALCVSPFWWLAGGLWVRQTVAGGGGEGRGADLHRMRHPGVPGARDRPRKR